MSKWAREIIEWLRLLERCSVAQQVRAAEVAQDLGHATPESAAQHAIIQPGDSRAPLIFDGLFEPLTSVFFQMVLQQCKTPVVAS